MKFLSLTLAMAPVALIAACSPGDTNTAAEPTEASEADQARMVEDAVRQNYAAQGAEVTEISMARNADGSRFAGRATVRDSATGNQIDVDCSYSQGPGGAPALDCNRTTGESPEPVVAPPPPGN